MPHIIIHHSSDINSQLIITFMAKLQGALVEIKEGKFSLEACKSRALSFDKFISGTKNQDQASFIHIELKILEGREEAIKQRVANDFLTISKDFIYSLNLKSRKDISIEITELDKKTYQQITI